LFIKINQANDFFKIKSVYYAQLHVITDTERLMNV